MKNEITMYKVDTAVISEDFINLEKGSKYYLSYVIRGGESEEDHMEKGQELVDKLLDENDDDYSRYVFMGAMYKDIGGINPHISVAQFRIRDSY